MAMQQRSSTQYCTNITEATILEVYAAWFKTTKNSESCKSQFLRHISELISIDCNESNGTFGSLAFE